MPDSHSMDRSANTAALRPGAENRHARISQKPCGALIQIAGWGTDFEPAVIPHLQALGFNGLGNFREVQTSRNVQSYRIAPDRLLLRSQDMSALKSAFAAHDPHRCALLDLSDARSAWLVDGPPTEHIMAQCMAIDFEVSAFPVNNFVQTGLHHVGCLVHRHSIAEFEILVPSSYARFVGEALDECS